MSTAARFRNSMDVLSPRLGEEGRWVVVPGSIKSHPSSQLRALKQRNRIKRRRRIFALLSWAAAAAMLSAIVGGPLGWAAALLLDGVLVAYAFFLIESKRRRVERAHKVRPISRKTRRESGFEFYEPAGAGGSRG